VAKVNCTSHVTKSTRIISRCLDRIGAVHAIWLRATVLCALICYFLSTICAYAQVNLPTDTQVKAAYLFNFGKFIRWQVPPAAVNDSFPICILGKNSFGPVLDTMVANEKIDGRPVVITQLASAQDAGQCRILFVSSSEATHVKTVLEATRRFQTLTVSDIPAFARAGGMIELVAQNDRIRFEVNLSPMNAAGLSVSSELLKVATKVTGAYRAAN
jgi:hypothetical protein